MSSHWWRHAACRTAPPDLFFPIGDGNPASTRTQTDAALAYCDRCPVTTECLADGEERQDYHGIRGGLTETERRNRRATQATAVADEAVA